MFTKVSNELVDEMLDEVAGEVADKVVLDKHPEILEVVNTVYE